MATPDKPPLTRERIVVGGVELADDEGVDGLTMRGLAVAIGSEPMSLYRHVASKADLIDGMVDAVAAEVELPDVVGAWRASVEALARSTAAALRRHPWAASRWLAGPPGPARIGLMESLLAALHRSGAPADVVDDGFHAIVNLVVGFGVAAGGGAVAGGGGDQRSGPPVDLEHHPHVVEHIAHHRRGADEGYGSTFTFTLEALLDALGRHAGHRA